MAVWMTVMVYSSGYLVVFASVALAVLLLVRIGAWRRRPVQVVGGFALAAVMTGLAALPVYLPYRRVAIEQGMVRTLDGVAQYSATLDGYIASYSRLHDWLWSAAAPRESPDAYFPGIVIALLALVAVSRIRQVWFPPSGGTPWLPPSGGIVLALLALAATGCVLSLGTRAPVYGWLYAVFPPMSALRAAARFGVLFLLGAALLGGIGLAVIRARLPRLAWIAGSRRCG